MKGSSMSDSNGKAKAPTAAQVAKLRKSGKTWNEIRAKLGVTWTDTRFRTLVRAAGYEPNGSKVKAAGAVRTRKPKKTPVAA
jgi:hypothetical protein